MTRTIWPSGAKHGRERVNRKNKGPRKKVAAREPGVQCAEVAWLKENDTHYTWEVRKCLIMAL